MREVLRDWNNLERHRGLPLLRCLHTTHVTRVLWLEVDRVVRSCVVGVLGEHIARVLGTLIRGIVWVIIVGKRFGGCWSLLARLVALLQWMNGRGIMAFV